MHAENSGRDKDHLRLMPHFAVYYIYRENYREEERERETRYASRDVLHET